MRNAFLSICLLICLSSTCYGLQIAPPWDDWTFPTPGPGIIVQIVPPDDIAAVLVPDGVQSLASHYFDSAERAEIINGTQLRMDISVVTSEWTMGSSWGVEPLSSIVIQSPSNPWLEIAPVVDWIWDGQSDETRTMVFNIPAQVDNPYINLMLITNRGVVDEAGFIYLHNAFLVPEPITAALLGLGSLILVRRRK
jgi:hypothetical protein